MAGTRWVLGALLRGRGCSCSSCQRTGAACLPLRPAAASASGLSGRRRLLLLLGAAAAQSRGLQVAVAASSLPSPAGPGFGALQGPLLHQAHPGRSYGQDSSSSFQDEYPPLSEYEPTPSKTGEEDDVFLIRAQGLPYSCTVEDVLSFFADCRIRNGERGIHFLLNRDGKRRGDALIELESQQDVQNALEKHWKYMGQRYVEGLDIVEITFVMDQRGRRKTGEAFVQFAAPEMANQALLKHKEEIGNRYIEIFPFRRSEVRSHSGLYRGKKTNTYPTTKLIKESESVFEENDLKQPLGLTVARESEKENESYREVIEKPRDASEFGSTSSSPLHFVHLRGLPFQASAQDIVNFFAPLKPAKITMEYNSSGKATGEADVYFETHEDAVAAMAKDRSYAQHRYIELFLNSSPKRKQDC
ncbi:G-rich sequence factor 1 isoform X2 [Gopherus flavomarginatus]|uniref:G-rich sequence factor 1 isoform X2 n=1 Tax=Gopherus flavomarginatus TaxID=286002 RepID=UPI0021CC47A7|nr:G-rich sequence factor 1 isoform X2 [Gopherus flavomarginatus]